MKTTFCKNCQSHTRIYSDFGSQYEFVYYCVDCNDEVSFNYKFCILCAGKGTRNNDVDGLLNR